MVGADFPGAYDRAQNRDGYNARSLSCPPAPHRRETLPEFR
jgi:hypothetical protein